MNRRVPVPSPPILSGFHLPANPGSAFNPADGSSVLMSFYYTQAKISIRWPENRIWSGQWTTGPAAGRRIGKPDAPVIRRLGPSFRMMRPQVLSSLALPCPPHQNPADERNVNPFSHYSPAQAPAIPRPFLARLLPPYIRFKQIFALRCLPANESHLLPPANPNRPIFSGPPFPRAAREAALSTGTGSAPPSPPDSASRVFLHRKFFRSAGRLPSGRIRFFPPSSPF